MRRILAILMLIIPTLLVADGPKSACLQITYRSLNGVESSSFDFEGPLIRGLAGAVLRRPGPGTANLPVLSLEIECTDANQVVFAGKSYQLFGAHVRGKMTLASGGGALLYAADIGSVFGNGSTARNAELGALASFRVALATLIKADSARILGLL